MTDGPLDMVRINLPVPDRLSAQPSGSWRGRHTVIRAMREATWAEARRVVGPNFPPMRKAMLLGDIHLPDMRKRDTLNILASCKPYIDGLIDAGVIIDDSWDHLLIPGFDANVSRGNPGVSLILERI
jgi:hypothetical protein